MTKDDLTEKCWAVLYRVGFTYDPVMDTWSGFGHYIREDLVRDKPDEILTYLYNWKDKFK